MKAIVLTSNSLRHKYFANIISKEFDVRGIISEPKVNYYNKVKQESQIIQKHFDTLGEYESQFFPTASFPEGIELLELEKSSINDESVVNWALEKEVDVVFLFGTVILKDIWLDNFKDKIINLHLGLSPFYRGSATLFWPIYNNELSCLGVTIHLATKKVDAGQIIGRIKPELEEGDNYYTMNYKAIQNGIDNLPNIVKKYLSGSTELIEQDLSISKLYKKSDFTEETLLTALDNIADGLTKDDIEKIKACDKCSF